MKKLLSVLITVAIAFCIYPAQVAALTKGDWVYQDTGNKTCMITGYTGEDKHLTIPDTIGTLKVTEIAGNVFSGNINLTSVTIPDSVQTIGECAFLGCSGLTSAEIGTGVRKIQPGMFSGCINLKSFTIGNNVESIGDGAFFGCVNLTGVIIPDSVKTIGISAFQGCHGLTSVTIGSNVKIIEEPFIICNGIKEFIVSPQNEYFCSEEGVLFNKDKSILVRYPSGNRKESYMVPDSVKTIDGGSFEACKYLVDIIIGDNVETLNGSVFSGCHRLTNVSVGNNVDKIGYATFDNCSKLETVTFSGDIPAEFNDDVFKYCSKDLKIIYDPAKSGWDEFFESSELNYEVLGNSEENQTSSDDMEKDLPNLEEKLSDIEKRLSGLELVVSGLEEVPPSLETQNNIDNTPGNDIIYIIIICGLIVIIFVILILQKRKQY